MKVKSIDVNDNIDSMEILEQIKVKMKSIKVVEKDQNEVREVVFES